MTKLHIGDWVTWTSQSNASTKRKRGQVVAVVPERSSVSRYIPAPAEQWTTMEYGLSRNHESYLVAVYPKAGSSAKPVLYWPRVAALQHAIPFGAWIQVGCPQPLPEDHDLNLWEPFPDVPLMQKLVLENTWGDWFVGRYEGLGLWINEETEAWLNGDDVVAYLRIPPRKED